MRILESSAAIRRALTDLMSPGKVRRVAITAFVGEGAGAFIRSPRGVEIICWPKAGGTNPIELRRLKKAGARIRFADRLHMKVYWAAGRGVIITSANLSTNALGAGNLKEFGVHLPAGAVPIDDVIRSLRSRPFNRAEMKKLEEEHRKLNAHRQHHNDKGEKVTYREWFSLLPQAEWKLGWWEEECDVARKADEIVRSDFNKRAPYDWISGTKNDYRKADWVLSFRLNEKGASLPRWIYVDFTVKVSRNDKNAYVDGYPYQAIQVFAPRLYTPPPFAITKSFRAALTDAVVAFGIGRIKGSRSARPPRDLLTMIQKRMK
jgi:hypothetical protein